MNMLFQHLLLISLNLHNIKVHVQHHEYIIIYMKISLFLTRHKVCGHRRANVKVHCG